MRDLPYLEAGIRNVETKTELDSTLKDAWGGAGDVENTSGLRDCGKIESGWRVWRTVLGILVFTPNRETNNTVAHSCHGKTKILTAKTKYLTAKPKTLRQKQNTSRQNQKPHGKTKDLTAKPNTSQQKPNTSRQKQIPTAKPKLFRLCCEVFGFAVTFLVLPWGFWFCRDSCGLPYQTSQKYTTNFNCLKLFQCPMKQCWSRHFHTYPRGLFSFWQSFEIFNRKEEHSVTYVFKKTYVKRMWRNVLPFYYKRLCLFNHLYLLSI